MRGSVFRATQNSSHMATVITQNKRIRFSTLSAEDNHLSEYALISQVVAPPGFGSKALKRDAG